MKSLRTFIIVSAVLATFLIELTAAGCECQSRYGGCRISNGADEGYKCNCTLQWTELRCSALTVKCNANEYCPAGCKTPQCCQNGGGDCGGYN